MRMTKFGRFPKLAYYWLCAKLNNIGAIVGFL